MAATEQRGQDAGDASRLTGLGPRGTLRSVMSMSPMPMVLTDPGQPDDPVIFCNPAFTMLTGFTEEDSLGRNCRFLQGPDTDQAAVRLLGDAVGARKSAQVDLWNYRKDGSRFWNSMFVGPVFDRQGELLYYFGSQTDASARRELEDARSHAQRMDTLGSMAAGIAHEVNNLMTIVLGNAERLVASTPGPKDLERVKRIGWAARETGKLTQQMLSFAGRQNLSPEAIDLGEVLRHSDRLLEQVAAPGRRVEVTPTGGPVTARVDAGQLQLALINLVRNASDATDDGGRIVIGARMTIGEGSTVAEISVRDDGSGMAPDIAAKADNPFFTTKAPGKGTGLGLSAVAGFCQQSGGRMVINTAPGEGTTVRLLFPQAQA